jgi:Ohr subfamily peroxiredoxin
MKKLKVDYTAVATNTGGRKGHVRSDDGLVDFDVAMPKEIGGEGGKTNPEQLLAAAYATCFGGALASVAGKISLRDSEIMVKVHLGSFGPEDYGIAADIFVKIPQAGSLEEAQKLADAAHEICLISKATRNSMEVNVKAIP